MPFNQVLAGIEVGGKKHRGGRAEVGRAPPGRSTCAEEMVGGLQRRRRRLLTRALGLPASPAGARCSTSTPG